MMKTATWNKIHQKSSPALIPRKKQLILNNFEANAEQTYDSNDDDEKHAYNYSSFELYFCLDPR